MERLNALQPHCPLCRQTIELAKHGRMDAISADYWGWVILIKPHHIGGESEILCSASSAFAGVFLKFSDHPVAHLIAPIRYKEIPEGTSYHFPPPHARGKRPPIMSIPLS